MGRGGKRAGAGRPRGSGNKKASLDAAKLLADGQTPLDVGLAAMRVLFESGKTEEAGTLAVKLAPYFHQRFAPTDQQPKPHREQDMLPLFGRDPQKGPEPVGKKELAQREAETAGVGTDWGEDLLPKDLN